MKLSNFFSAIFRGSTIAFRSLVKVVSVDLNIHVWKTIWEVTKLVIEKFNCGVLQWQFLLNVLHCYNGWLLEYPPWVHEILRTNIHLVFLCSSNQSFTESFWRKQKFREQHTDSRHFSIELLDIVDYSLVHFCFVQGRVAWEKLLCDSMLK